MVESVVTPNPTGVQEISLPDGTTGWLVTGYDEAQQALSEQRLSKVLTAEEVGLTPELTSAMLRQMLFLDPPDHTRLRRLVSSAFTARSVEALRPRIDQIATELLDTIAGQETVDLIETFANPLPLQVICELLGVPLEDRAAFRDWSAIIAAGPARQHEMPEALNGLLVRIRAMLVDRAARPGTDLVSDLVAAGEEGDRLSADELTSMVFMLVIAGYETTVNLIGSGALMLLEDRDRWIRMRGEPGLLPAAVEEFIRFEPPIAVTTQRRATATVTLGGRTIPAGSRVMVSLADDNRDPARFPDADELRLDRSPARHLGFGYGVHHCIGAPLARAQAQAAFTALMTRFPDLSLAVPVESIGRRTDFQRGVTELPVHLRGEPS